MDELTRFARILVERLGARPEGVHRPVTVGAVRHELLPYRVERRTLGLSSVEDYESVLLRLVSEERGFVKTTPSAAAERCREILSQPNPDLGVLEEIADSMIQVTSLAAAQTVLAEEPPAVVTEAAVAPPVAPAKQQGDGCGQCGKALPKGRAATFCPWCGHRLVPLTCGRCSAEFESGWRHCISCGAPVTDPYSQR